MSIVRTVSARGLHVDGSISSDSAMGGAATGRTYLVHVLSCRRLSRGMPAVWSRDHTGRVSSYGNELDTAHGRPLSEQQPRAAVAIDNGEDDSYPETRVVMTQAKAARSIAGSVASQLWCAW